MAEPGGLHVGPVKIWTGKFMEFVEICPILAVQAEIRGVCQAI